MYTLELYLLVYDAPLLSSSTLTDVQDTSKYGEENVATSQEKFAVLISTQAVVFNTHRAAVQLEFFVTDEMSTFLLPVILYHCALFVEPLVGNVILSSSVVFVPNTQALPFQNLPTRVVEFVVPSPTL